MAVEWSEASDSVLVVARELIDEFHQHLREATIAFIYRNEAAISKGRKVYAQVQKVPDRWKVLLDDEYDILIWISKEDWDARTSSWREALIDHELSHCTVGENGFTTTGHDFEGFKDVVERHGLWNYDLLTVGEQIRQLKLPLGDTVSMSTGGRTVTLSAEKLAHVADIM